MLYCQYKMNKSIAARVFEINIWLFIEMTLSTLKTNGILLFHDSFTINIISSS